VYRAPRVACTAGRGCSTEGEGGRGDGEALSEPGRQGTPEDAQAGRPHAHRLSTSALHLVISNRVVCRSDGRPSSCRTSPSSPHRQRQALQAAPDQDALARAPAGSQGSARGERGYRVRRRRERREGPHLARRGRQVRPNGRWDCAWWGQARAAVGAACYARGQAVRHTRCAGQVAKVWPSMSSVSPPLLPPPLRSLLWLLHSPLEGEGRASRRRSPPRCADLSPSASSSSRFGPVRAPPPRSTSRAPLAIRWLPATSSSSCAAGSEGICIQGGYLIFCSMKRTRFLTGVSPLPSSTQAGKCTAGVAIAALLALPTPERASPSGLPRATHQRGRTSSSRACRPVVSSRWCRRSP
jgi:hypothetical protein